MFVFINEFISMKMWNSFKKNNQIFQIYLLNLKFDKIFKIFIFSIQFGSNIFGRDIRYCVLKVFDKWIIEFQASSLLLRPLLLTDVERMLHALYLSLRPSPNRSVSSQKSTHENHFDIFAA